MKLEGKQLGFFAIKTILIAISLGIALGWFIFVMLNTPNVVITGSQCLTLIGMIVYAFLLESEVFIIRRMHEKYKVLKTLLTVHFGLCSFVLSFMLIVFSIRFAQII